MRPVANGDPVAARRVGQVLHDRPHVLLVPAEREGAHAEPLGHEQVAVELEGILPGPRRRVPDGEPDVAAIGLDGGAGDHHDRPVDRHPVEAVGAGLHVAADPRARLRVPEPGERGLAAAGVRPRGQRGVEVRHAGEVGIRVERDLEASRPRLVDEREHLGGAAPVHREVHEGVSQVDGDARAAADLEARLVTLEGPGAVVSVMRLVVAAVGVDRLAEGDDLVVRPVHPRRVGEAGREPDRAVPHRLGHEMAHAGQLRRRRRAILEPDDGHADSAVADQGRHVR